MSETRKITLQFPSLRAFLAEYGERIAADGMLLRGVVPPEVGSNVEIEVVVAEGMRLLRARGETLWSETAVSGRQNAAAVRFDDLDAASRTLIGKIVDQRRRDGAEVFELQEVPGPREARLRDLTRPAAPAPEQPGGGDDAIFDLAQPPAAESGDLLSPAAAEPAAPQAGVPAADPPRPAARQPVPPVPLLAHEDPPAELPAPGGEPPLPAVSDAGERLAAPLVADGDAAPFDLGSAGPADSADSPGLDPGPAAGDEALRPDADNDLSDLFGGDEPQMAPARGRTEAFPASFVDEVEAELEAAETPSNGYYELDTSELEVRLGSSVDEPETLPPVDLSPDAAGDGAVDAASQAAPPEAASEPMPEPRPATPLVEPRGEAPLRVEQPSEPAPPVEIELEAPPSIELEPDVAPPVEVAPEPAPPVDGAAEAPSPVELQPPPVEDEPPAAPAAVAPEPTVDAAASEVEAPAVSGEPGAPVPDPAIAAETPTADQVEAEAAAEPPADETAAAASDAAATLPERVAEAFNAAHGPETVEIPIVEPQPSSAARVAPPPPMVDSPILGQPPAGEGAAVAVPPMDDNLLSIPEFGPQATAAGPPAEPEVAQGIPLAADSLRGAASRSRHLGTWLLIALLVSALGVAGYFLWRMIQQETGSAAPATAQAVEPSAPAPKAVASPLETGDEASAGPDEAAPAEVEQRPEEPGEPAPSPAVERPEPAAPLTGLSRITWTETDAETVLALIGDGAIPAERVELVPIAGDQPRLVIKLAAVERPFQPAVLEVGTAHVRRVRTGLQSNGELHVVVDLAAPRVVLRRQSTEGTRMELRFGAE